MFVLVIISDAAKSANTAEDMTVYTSLESAANLTMKFHMNPVSNYTVDWSMDSSNTFQDINVRNTVKDNQVKTTYFVSNVTKNQLGNYTVRVINSAIASEHNEAIFSVILKLKGKKSNNVQYFTQHVLQAGVIGMLVIKNNRKFYFDFKGRIALTIGGILVNISMNLIKKLHVQYFPGSFLD